MRSTRSVRTGHAETVLSSCESLNGIGDWTKMGNEISKPRILRFGENPNCNLRQEIPCVADIVASRFPGFQVFVLRRRRGAHLHTHVSGAYTHRQFFMKWVFLHQDASRVSYLGPLLGCSAAAAYMVPAGASGIDGATAFPSCALSAAGRFGTVFVRAAAFRGAIAGFGFLAAPAWVTRFRPDLAAARFADAAGTAFFGVAGFTAALALAFLAVAQRRLVAAMIRARPSGLRRRFFFAGFATAGFTASSALAFRAAAQRFLCAAAIRRRAVAPSTRFVGVAPGGAAETG